MEKIVFSKEYCYLERQKIIDEICNKYAFVKKSVIGKSCLGRNITALKIGSAAQYTLITAAFHGSEHITSNVLLMFIEELCEALDNGGYIAGLNARRALRGRGIIFIPCINPDGCEISITGRPPENDIANIFKSKTDFKKWNANARGVDINHNFDADWYALREKERNEGIYGPAPSRFGGYKPESEPETQTLVNLCKKADIRHILALHSQGEVIYWNYGKNMPYRSRKMAEIMATSSGYALDVPISIATGGGFKDWFIDKFNRPGFTIEIGKGENPLPIEMAEKIYEQIKETLVLCSIM